MKTEPKYHFVIILILILCSCKETDQNKFIPNSDNKNLKEQNSESSSYKPSDGFDHIKHIRKNSRIGHIDGVENNPKYFVDHTIKNLIKEKEHKKYITDRKLLRKLNNKTCWDNYVSIVDTLLNGDKIKIELKSQEFDTINRSFNFHPKSNFLIEVDGKYPYGSVYAEKPSRELKSLVIKINGTEIETQVHKYQNLYEPEFCNFGGHQRITEAYEDGSNIYIYIFGGIAADSYFAKLIFNATEGFVTTIVAEYSDLSDYGSFGKHFIGF